MPPYESRQALNWGGRMSAPPDPRTMRTPPPPPGSAVMGGLDALYGALPNPDFSTMPAGWTPPYVRQPGQPGPSAEFMNMLMTGQQQPQQPPPGSAVAGGLDALSGAAPTPDFNSMPAGFSPPYVRQPGQGGPSAGLMNLMTGARQQQPQGLRIGNRSYGRAPFRWWER